MEKLEKWCVRITDKSLVPDKYKSPIYDDYYAYSHKINNARHNYYTGGNKMDEYPEITFVKFQQLVLNKSLQYEIY